MTRCVECGRIIPAGKELCKACQDYEASGGGFWPYHSSPTSVAIRSCMVSP